jgi:hypothetical protein
MLNNNASASTSIAAHFESAAPDSHSEPTGKYYLFYRTGRSLIVFASSLEEAVRDSSGEEEQFKGAFDDWRSADIAGTKLLQVDCPQVEDAW